LALPVSSAVEENPKIAYNGGTFARNSRELALEGMFCRSSTGEANEFGFCGVYLLLAFSKEIHGYVYFALQP
jgi:hypothetical protein